MEEERGGHAVRSFIKGLDLSEAFFNQVGKKILEKDFPNIKYSAALIGYGSDVIGFDTAMSTDHMWGPRFYIFLEEANFETIKQGISQAFSEQFPHEFMGYSTHFPEKEDEKGIRTAEKLEKGPVEHLIFFDTLKGFFESYLGWDIGKPPSKSDWLTFPEHRLLAVTSGRVFYDALGLEALRQQVEFFPKDIWLYLLASQWAMISEEEAFVGRCGDVGDELGSSLVSTRIVHHLMRLCFLMEERYAPYSKWFGTAFMTLERSKKLSELLEQVVHAGSWKSRQESLASAYTIVVEYHNELSITPWMDSQTRFYYNRPYEVIFAERIVSEIMEQIEDKTLHDIVKIGSVTHFSEVTRVNDNLSLCKSFKQIYE